MNALIVRAAEFGVTPAPDAIAKRDALLDEAYGFEVADEVILAVGTAYNR